MMPSLVLLMLLNLFSLNRILVAMPTCMLAGDLVQESLKLLRELGELNFPVDCRPYNHNISFPDSAFPQASANHPQQCRQALWVLYKSLEGVERMFENYTCPDTWDEFIVDSFRNLQSQLLGQGECLSHDGSSGVLSSYFSNVTAVLQQEDGSLCGWSALKTDLLKVLYVVLHEHRTCFTWRHDH